MLARPLSLRWGLTDVVGFVRCGDGFVREGLDFELKSDGCRRIHGFSYFFVLGVGDVVSNLGAYIRSS